MNAEATGMLVDGRHIFVKDLTIIGPGDAPWVRLEARDYQPRQAGIWIRQIILHSTWGGWPHILVSGAGPRGGAKATADYWHTSPDGKRQSGGAHIVIDENGDVVCLVDLVRAMAYHATTANPHSIGIEMYQRPDGRIYEAVLNAAIKLVAALCYGAGATYENGDPWLGLGIPFQVPRRTYNNAPIERMRLHGGPDMAGVFGHRDVAWLFPWQFPYVYRDPAELARAQKMYPNGYSDRGRGDPGDEVGNRLVAAGAEAFDFDAREDITAWKRRQQHLVALGDPLFVDGEPGPKTRAAMLRHGFMHGRDVAAAT